jgi:inorganic pyrophosphatase
VKFEAADGLHYGWIPETIDDDGEPSVTLGAPGFATTPDQAILAGTGTAVPFR